MSRRAPRTPLGAGSVTLWLGIAPQALALDALSIDTPPDAAGEVAVTAGHGAHRWVVASNAGLFPGADVRDIMAARPTLRLYDTDHGAEATALETLTSIAHGLGQPVHCEHRPPSPEWPTGHAAVWVEIGRSLRLLGGIDGAMEQARTRLAGQALRCRLAAAPTLQGAALAARLDDGCVLHDRSALRSWLQHVPLHALPLPAQTREAITACGIRHLGALLALPVDQLSRRFGAALVQQLDRLTGHAPDPRRPHRLPRRFMQQQRLDGSVHHVEGLLFPLKRLFGNLGLYLQARDCGARSARLHLLHEDSDDTELRLTLATPARDAGHWLLMARERLARVQLRDAVIGLRLHCEDFAPLEVPQLDLFDTARAEQDAWQRTVERLVARLGEEAVWQLAAANDHRPERAWQRQTALAGEGAQASVNTPGGLQRPLWLLDPPRPLPRPPRLHGHPERIEAGWWDGNDAVRDYYTAEDERGRRLWVFHDHAAQRWFLHGLWA